jgi:hypothetical protein
VIHYILTPFTKNQKTKNYKSALKSAFTSRLVLAIDQAVRYLNKLSKLQYKEPKTKKYKSALKSAFTSHLVLAIDQAVRYLNKLSKLQYIT